MKHTSKIALLCGAAMALASACTDGNDWETDGSHAGLFRPTSFSAEQTSKGETTVKFTVGGVPGVSKYEIEVATDTFAVEDAAGQLYETTSSTATIDGFVIEQTYYARVRAIGESGMPSAWVGAKKFTLAAGQIIDESSVTTTMTTVSFAWEAGAAATRATVETADGALVKEIELTEADMAASSLKIEGLQAATIYVVRLFNGDNRVGMANAQTTSAGPTGDYTATYSASKTMGALLDEVAAKAAEDGNSEYSVTVIIPAGVTAIIAGDPAEGSTDEYSTLTIPSGMSVTFYGESGDAKDAIQVYKSVNIAGVHAMVKFQNLTITGTESQKDYMFNQSDACAVDSVVFKECKVSGFAKSFCRTQGGTYDATNYINVLSLENCVFSNIGQGYGFIHVDGTIINNVVVDGCTFNDINEKGKCFFMQSKYTQDIESLRIRNCTFYNFCGSGQYFIDFKDAAYGPATFEMTNIIFGKTADETTNKNVRGTCNVADYTTNCYSLSDCYKVIKGSTVSDKSSADVFADPANGDFTLKSGCGIEKCGDPRWY